MIIKTIIWILKCISSVTLLFMITGDTFLGKEVSWLDLTVIIWIDILLLICLHPIVKPFSQPKEQHKNIVLYILLYGEMIKGFGYSLSDLTYQLNSLRTMPLPATISRQTIKITKIIISEVGIISKDIIIE